ncbi:hypothetical protein WDU94_006569 [Cyamophila willieti]
MSTDSTNGSSVELNTTSAENKTIHDDFNDFDNPMPMKNIDRTIAEFNTNLSKLLQIVEHFEELNNDVVAKNKIDVTVEKGNKNNANRIKNLIMNRDENLGEIKERCLFSENTVDVMNYDVSNKKDCQDTANNSKESQQSIDNVNERKNVQYNDYNDKIYEARVNNEIDETDRINGNQVEELINERTELIDDILLKYCRENVSDFERNLRNDVYYNTLRSVIELFVKDVLSEKKKFDNIEANITKAYKDNNENEGDETGKPDVDLDNNEKTMKPNIHRVNELKVNQNDISTVEMKIVTSDAKTESIRDESDGYSQKNVADIVKKIETDSNPKSEKDDPKDSRENLNEDLTKTDWANSSKNDKVVAEYLLNNKLKQEIKRINFLIDEINAYNKSLNYSHIQVNKNNSLHEIVEKLREKRNVHLQQRMKRSNDFMTSFFNINNDAKNVQFNELLTYLEEYEKTKLKRQKRWFIERQGSTCGLFRDNHFLEESTESDPNAPARQYNLREGPRKAFRLKRSPQNPDRLKRSKSEEDYNAREAKRRQKKSAIHNLKSNSIKNKDGHVNVKKMYNQKLSPSKEKYYYPRDPTHDPGDELWKMVKKDYETNPKIRDIIDKSHVDQEKFESHMWNCNRVKRSDHLDHELWTKEKGDKSRHPGYRTSSEEEYLEKEYKKKMKAEFKKRLLTDESPETTEPTTPDLRWLDCSRSKAKVTIDIGDLGLSNPEEVMRNLKKREVNNANNDDVFERYDPSDDDFIENLAQHAKKSQNRRKRRHVTKNEKYAVNVNNKQKRDIGDQEIPNKVNENEKDQKISRIERNILLDKLQPRHRRDVNDNIKPAPLSVENVDKIPEYDQYHGFKYGQTEVFEGGADLSGMYERYTAPSVGPYQKKRYEAFRKFYLDATSTWCDPFIKVSLAVCPFCGDYFGNREKLLFHENYNHFNIFSTVVPVTLEPTVTVSPSVKHKDMNDIFEEILKNQSLASASEKWADFIDENINPTKRDEYRHLLFNKSLTAFITVQGHDIGDYEELQTQPEDADVKVLSYPSEYHRKKNFTYDEKLLKSQKKSIPVVNLYENPEKFIKKLIDHEPLVEEEHKK